MAYIVASSFAERLHIELSQDYSPLCPTMFPGNGAGVHLLLRAAIWELHAQLSLHGVLGPALGVVQLEQCPLVGALCHSILNWLAAKSDGRLQSPEHEAHYCLWNSAEASACLCSMQCHMIMFDMRVWINLLRRKLMSKDHKRIRRNAKSGKHQMVTKKTLPSGKISVPEPQQLHLHHCRA